MAEFEILADQKIQDYIDGRLDERDRAAVAAYLLAHPSAAVRVETLRRQNEALRGIGQEILDEPVPTRLREVLHRERRQPTGRTLGAARMPETDRAGRGVDRSSEGLSRSVSLSCLVVRSSRRSTTTARDRPPPYCPTVFVFQPFSSSARSLLPRSPRRVVPSGRRSPGERCSPGDLLVSPSCQML